MHETNDIPLSLGSFMAIIACENDYNLLANRKETI